MNKLLIHSNNTSFNRDDYFLLYEQFFFDIDFDKDVDYYIDENLTSGDLKSKLEVANVVFIKISLSQNYLEFLGIRLAYHIRLTKNLGEKSKIPIVFISEESIQFIGQTYDEPTILFTKGIYFIRENSDDLNSIINQFKVGKLKPLDDLSRFFKSIDIAPPANYQSHHSIANEWCILRWAKALGIKDKEGVLQEIKDKIGSLLYYKYLQAKCPLDIEPCTAEVEILGKGKILLIDDEWEKGWAIVFEGLMAFFNQLTFETFKINFKDKPTNEIIEASKKKVTDFNPDLVILDLRLSDSDFKHTKPEDFTGFKILREIKSINPGIQVLIFTASNKVWNLVDLQTAGADGFILKESPENSLDPDFTKFSINKMTNAVSLGLRKSFLKKIHLLNQTIKTITFTNQTSDEKEFYIRVNYNLDLAYKLLTLTHLSAKYFNYAYLQLFQILEDFSNLPTVFIEGADSYVVVNRKEVLVQKTLENQKECAISFEDGKYKIKHKIFTAYFTEKRNRLDTNFKVSAILIFRMGHQNSSFLKWTDIYTIRNQKAAHFNQNENIDENMIFSLLEFIKYFIDGNNQNDENVAKGLKTKSLEESIELLKKRFNNK